ncbi:terminase large subunit domain-containing protein [Nocardia otitidiscaviarum]|uniref:terminase large subunit domain-containing protein n=1 Tax=Nocardia otitidiscaviarum TaxID=1823 RepID=UPI0004A72ACA|nr:terminase family protein [Nocardia otitidiscaviarum]
MSEVARHVIAPVGIKSTGWPRVRDTCARLGWGFDGWQDGAGRLILAKGSDGLYAADTIVMSIPRQVGKTYLVACIIFALCLDNPGLTVIWTAHRKTTAAETFAQFEGMAQRPKVAAHIRQVLRGKGDEKILFNNRARILFGARESGFGRGMTNIDILVFDEGQILKDDTLEDMGAAQNVARNPLTFVMGTPPRPKDPGEFFTLLRQEALDGDADGTLYIELSADRGCDPMDREQWRKANPSFPRRTSERAMLRLRKKLTNDDSWRREALGIWDEISKHMPAIKLSLWRNELVDVGPAAGVRPDALAVDMSHAREISITACWIEGDSAHAEEVWAGTDSDAAIEWILERTNRRMPIVIDGMSPAASFVPVLRSKKRNVIQTSAGDMAKACGLLVDKANAKRFTHANQESVTAALAGAVKRAIGTAGGWGWDRRDETVNIAPIVSMTLALFGAEATKRARSGGASFA